ncbi:hypothetical protein [Actinomyces radicidentis]|uniref:hypothetical protein n=1 Tax=Actinomyces radicidentis TaxID=111015 RepID=UPI000A4D37E0|nr:hypothetical protein [Actinomyces radicidentis]
MPETRTARVSAGAAAFLADCAVDPAVLELRPDYRAMLVVVEGIDAGAPSSVADGLIAAAEERARELLAGTPVIELPHVAVWREAYKAFGAKLKRTRNSLEALTRRAGDGLPRVNALTDLYNGSPSSTRSPSAVRTSPAMRGRPALCAPPARRTSTR